jgi:dihydrofolate synthase/folylpolyglutamate synthase
MIPDLSAEKPLDAWLSYIAEIHDSAIDLDLCRVAPLAEQLELTHFPCPVVTVGGTNGKGSVVRSLESIYLAHDYRVAAYTSPHLMHFSERLRLNGENAPDSLWATAFAEIERARVDLSLSFFEFTTLAALWICKMACKTQALDLLILEVGLGGRLDAVNVVEPGLSIITNVDLDHLDWLGDTRELIGREKAGIFRAAKPAICGDPSPPASVLDAAAQLDAPLYLIHRDYGLEQQADGAFAWSGPPISVNLIPSLQLKPENVASALMATRFIDLPLNAESVVKSLVEASLPGRFERYYQGCLIIFDVAHNPQSAAYLQSRFAPLPIRGRRRAVVGMLKDKDMAASLAPFVDCIDDWYLGGLWQTRGAHSEELATHLPLAMQSQAHRFDTISQAFSQALADISPDDAILVFGSFHTVAEAKRVLSGDL